MRSRQKEDKRAEAARVNGLKGGRPPAWSVEARTAAVRCLQQYARTLKSTTLADELMRLAQALEDGKLRLRINGVTTDRPTQAIAPHKPSAVETRQMRVMIKMHVNGGRSSRGRLKAEQEVVEHALGRYRPKQEDGWDYSLTVSYKSDEELDSILMEIIPGTARMIAAKRHCKIEYSARSLDDPSRTWKPAPPVPSPLIQRLTRLTLSLRLQVLRRGSNGKKKAHEEIERQVFSCFPVQKLHDKEDEYLIAVGHATDEQLDRIINEQILEQVKSIARDRHCYVECELHKVDDPERSWCLE